MTRLAATMLALAALAACSTYDPNYTASPPNPDPLPLAQGTIIVPAGAVAVPAGPVVAAPATTVIAVPPAAYRFEAGNGTVESVAPVQWVASATAGASAVPTRNAYRLTIRMDDGLVQTFDQDSSAFRPGDRVEVTRDARILRR
jgi:hypothetical protein